MSQCTHQAGSRLVVLTLLFAVCREVVRNDLHCLVVDLLIRVLLKLLHLVQSCTSHKGEGEGEESKEEGKECKGKGEESKGEGKESKGEKEESKKEIWSMGYNIK